MKLFFMLLHGSSAFLLLVHGESPSGFISIDCGISDGSYYKDEGTTISYTSDVGYIDTGTNHNISSAHMSDTLPMQLSNLRSFPDGIKNCYTINRPDVKGNKYLIRATFMYGDYDSKDQPPEFSLYLDGDQWTTIRFYNASHIVRTEIIHVPETAYIHVCLVKNISLGAVPFISALELRRLDNSIYKTESGSLKLFTRLDVGSTTNKTVRYSDDVYDRIWVPDTSVGFTTSAWERISAAVDIGTLSNNSYQPPFSVMDTAITPVNGSNLLKFWCVLDYPNQKLYMYMHFAELGTLQHNQLRKFDIYVNDEPWYRNMIPPRLQPFTIFSLAFVTADSLLDISIDATEDSTLPPILNAIEIYEVRELESPTNQTDVDAIRKIKSAYRVERNWQGDPCIPRKYSWGDLQCNYESNSPRIISLNLSSSSLSGNMDISFSDLESLESLDLSNNNLTGQVPDFLSRLPFLKTLNLSWNNFTGSLPSTLVEKSKTGSLTLRTEGNLLLLQAGNSSKCQADSCARKNNYIVPLIASIASCLVIVALILAVWWSLAIWRNLKRKKQQEDIVKPNAEDDVVEKKRQFTYPELMTITNNFQKVLGKGGSGSVYAGHLTEGTQVAVKMLSQPSIQGSKQFRTEAQLLTKVHHRNLVSIIGYCNDDPHLGLIYDYMANGTIKEHLSENSANILSWEQRLRIACDAAQGLEYLHDGCKPPIVHRDIKTANILLAETMQAKISDFGISRLMPLDGGASVSTTVAGTPGYMDPEYQVSNELTEKSDVYSFGIVLLELITGKPAVQRTHGNIVDWVRSLVETAEIQEIVDSRLSSNFNTNSAWKVVETAMECVESTSIQRPLMRQVVAELRESLEMEIARVKDWNENEQHNSASGSSVYASLGSSIAGPSAR